jgi:hypothetical protein
MKGGSPNAGVGVPEHRNRRARRLHLRRATVERSDARAETKKPLLRRPRACEFRDANPDCPDRDSGASVHRNARRAQEVGGAARKTLAGSALPRV